jgi:transposase
MGVHYTMGNMMIKLVASSGNMDAETTDYDVISISNQMSLSKSTDLTFGITRKGNEGTDASVRTYGFGLTHKF